jgi:hypothetical protein
MLSNYRNSLGDNRRRLVIAITGAFVLALAPAAASAASDPTDAQYGSTLSQISQGGGSAGGGSADGSAVGGLPFTGLDVALLAAVAAGLVLVGLMLRRRRPADASKA